MPTIQLPTWVSHPGRGTLRAMHGTLQPSLSTGAAHVHFPLKLTPARSLTPDLSLDYHSNQGNGVFGMGFDLNGLISISRNTKHGVPSYDESDTFILSTAGELVKVSDEDEQGWTAYRPRVDSQFSKILYHPEQGWVIHQANGVNHYLGENPGSCVADLDNTAHVFEWKVSQTKDALGNEIHYIYEADGADRYLSSIQYGKVPSGGFAFDLVFDYGEKDGESEGVDNPSTWKEDIEKRPDQFTSYRSGFALSTKRLCHRIALYHHFDEFSKFPSGRALVKYWSLNYKTDDVHQGLSSLADMQEVGCRTKDGVSYLTKALPAAIFKYQSLQSKEMKPFELPENSALPGLRGSYQWIDLYREGLPGILYNDDTTALYWRSKGQGEFAAPESLTQFPNMFHPSVPTHCRVMHLGPSQETAFVVVTPDQAGYYSLNEQETEHTGSGYHPGWQGYHSFEKIPNEFTNPWNEVMDLNGSHQEDLVVLNSSFPYYYPSKGTSGYGKPKPLDLQPDFPRSQFNSDAIVRFMDIFGDGLLHRVKVTAEGISIWPNLGHGKFGEKINWDLPVFSTDESFVFDARRIFLRDIDGSGAVDFVYATKGHVYAHLNLGTGFSDTFSTLKLPEEYTHDDQLLFGDFFGEAVTSVMLIKSGFDAVRYYHGSFASAKPYLLEEMTQSFGVKTQLTYSTSTAMQQDELKKVNLDRNKKGESDLDVLAGCRLPFSLPVLSQVTVYDPLTHVNVTTSYAYYQGHYDFAERRFCGFGFVREFRGETNIKTIQDLSKISKLETTIVYPDKKKDPEDEPRASDLKSKEEMDDQEGQEITVDPLDARIQQSQRKHWFHNGVNFDNAAKLDSTFFSPYHDEKVKGAEVLSTKAELYYKKDESNQGVPVDLGDELTDPQKEAFFSTQGRQWRMELWLADHPLKKIADEVSEVCGHPLHIEQFVYNVRCEKEPDVNPQAHGVFTLQQRMSVSLQLEAPVGDQAAEARISQSANIRFDLNNNVLKEVHIAVGRSEVFKKINSVPFALDGQSQNRLEAVQQTTQIIYKQTQYAKPITEIASKDDFQYLHLTADSQVFDLSEEGINPKSVEELVALEPTPEHLYHHEQRLYWDSEQKEPLSVGQWDQRALLHHSVTLLASVQQMNQWPESLTDPQEGVGKAPKWIDSLVPQSGDKSSLLKMLMTENGYLPGDFNGPSEASEGNAPKAWWQPGKIHHYGDAKKYYQVVMVIDAYSEDKDPSLFHRIDIDRDDYQLAAIKIQHYLPSGKPAVTSMKIDYQALQSYKVVDPNGITHLCVHDPLGVVIAQTRYKGDLGNPVDYAATAFEMRQMLNQPDLKGVIADKAGILGKWLFVKCYAYLPGSSVYTVELRSSDYAQKPEGLASNENQIYCAVTYFDGSGHVLDKIRQKSKDEWVSSGAQLQDQAGHLLTRFLPDEPKSPEFAIPTDVASLRNIYDGAFCPVAQYLPNGCQKKTDYYGWYRINFDENTSSKYPSTPEIVFLTPAGRMGGTLKQLGDQNILETTQYNIAGQPICHQDARSINSLEITYDLVGRVVLRNSVDRGPEYMFHNARGKVTRRQLGVHLHEDAYDSWERVTGKSVWSDSKSDPKWIQTESRVYGDSADNNKFNQLVLLQNEEAVTHFDAFDLGGLCIGYRRHIFLPSLENLMKQVGPHQYQEDKKSADGMLSFVANFEAEYDALGNLLTETLPDGAVYNHEYNTLAQLTDIVDSDQKPVVSGMDYNAAGLLTEIIRGKALKTTQTYDQATQRLIKVQTGKLQDQQYGYDNVGNVVKMTLGAQELHYSYDPLYRLASADGLEFEKMPAQSDSKKIAHQLFSAETPIESYTQTFQYDISGNMTQIKHGDAWRLDFNVSGESNRFNKLTTPDGNQLSVDKLKTVPEKDSKKLLYDAAGNMLTTDNIDALHWSHRNELRHVMIPGEQTGEDRAGQKSAGGGRATKSAVATTDKVEEYYGYDSSEGVPFEDKIKHRHALGLFGAGLKASRSKLLQTFGNRLFKVSVFHHSSGEFSVVEQIFLGTYERKRIYKGPSLEALTLKLDRHTHRFELDGQPLATYHRWEKDDAKSEIPGKPEQWQYHLSDKLHSSVMDVTEVECEDKEMGKKVKLVKLVKLSQQAYQPYGAIAYIRTSDDKQLRRMDYHYSGKMHDQVTGLYYYGARYYAPQFGRWLSPDPAGLVDGLNLYGMVRNNPMTFLDVWGMVVPGANIPQISLGLAKGAEQVRRMDPALKAGLVSGAAVVAAGVTIAVAPPTAIVIVPAAISMASNTALVANAIVHKDNFDGKASRQIRAVGNTVNAATAVVNVAGLAAGGSAVASAFGGSVGSVVEVGHPTLVTGAGGNAGNTADTLSGSKVKTGAWKSMKNVASGAKKSIFALGNKIRGAGNKVHQMAPVESFDSVVASYPENASLRDLDITDPNRGKLLQSSADRPVFLSPQDAERYRQGGRSHSFDAQPKVGHLPGSVPFSVHS